MFPAVPAGLALIGLLITALYHVPHNDQLLTVDPHAVDAPAIWTRYHRPWLAWNHARTLASFGATVSLVVALRRG